MTGHIGVTATVELAPPTGGACSARPDADSVWFALPLVGQGTGKASRPAREAALERHTEAIRTCARTCPAVVACLAWAMENEGHGVWGGLASWERHFLGGVTTIERHPDGKTPRRTTLVRRYPAHLQPAIEAVLDQYAHKTRAGRRREKKVA